MIEKFQKGQPILASQLNALVDAANRLSGGCRPPSQIRARVPSSQSVIFADDWRTIAQAQPTTVPTANVARGSRAYSNNSGSYDSTSNGLRMIIHYETPIKSYGTTRPVFSLGITDTGYGTTLVNYSGGGGTSTGYMYLWMRVRPILADWDPTTITWSNYSTELTIDSNPIAYPILCKNYAIATSGGEAQGSQMGDGVCLAFSPVTASPGDIFGLVIDCRPSTSTANYTSCMGHVSFTASSTTYPAPYVIVPEA